MELTERCSHSGCLEYGEKFCGSCGIVSYCGTICQRKHWKVHRSLCLMKQTKEFLPFDKVVERINQITKIWAECESTRNTTYALKVLKYLLSFAEYQYGESQVGNTFRERMDGHRVDNRIADTELWQISSTLGNRLYNQRTKSSYQEAEVYFLKARVTLERWRVSADESNVETILPMLSEKLSITERYLADLYASQGRFEEAEYHCSECLKFATRTVGECHTIELFKALRTYGYLHERQSNYVKAISYFEDAYICVSEAYGPVHPRVQEAAGYLTDSLLQSKSYARAEGYARINYESLIDPSSGISPDSFEVARGAQQLAQICYSTPSNLGIVTVGYEEGVLLARKALLIIERVFPPDHINVGSSINDLARVLLKSGCLGDETRDLFRRALAVYIVCDGADGLLVMEACENLGSLHFQRGSICVCTDQMKIEFRFSDRYFNEALRISLIVFGQGHEATSQLRESLSSVKCVL